MKRKIMSIILVGVCAVCLTACGKSEEDAASDYYQEQFGMSEKDADELANALYGNGGVQTEAKPETEAAPETEAEAETEAELPLEYVEPAAEDFKYNYDAALGGVVITKYTGEAEAIRIPIESDGDPVVKICLGDPSTLSLYPSSPINEKTTHVELPDGITSIDDNAFVRCFCLTEIIIPDSITSISSWTFYGCSSLTEVTIPEGVTYIGLYAFRDCGSLRNLTIPDNAEIEKGAFSGADGLTVTYQGEEYNYANDPNGWW